MTDEAAATEATQEGTTSEETTVSKPEGLEDSFWDTEKGEIRLDSLIKSHNDTRAKVHQNEEAFREKFMAEVQGNRPEEPAKYEIKDLGIEAPEGYEFNFKDDDPMLNMWRNMAFQSNLSNDQFMEGVRTWVNHNMSARVDPHAELEKLGENGKDRQARLDLVLNKHLTAEEINSIGDLTQTAEGFQVLEKLLTSVGQSRIPNVDDVSETGKGLTLADLQAMQQDVRYHGRGGPRNPDFIAQVNAGFAKLYPGKANTQG